MSPNTKFGNIYASFDTVGDRSEINLAVALFLPTPGLFLPRLPAMGRINVAEPLAAATRPLSSIQACR
jgi:hypothetical protein